MLTSCYITSKFRVLNKCSNTDAFQKYASYLQYIPYRFTLFIPYGIFHDVTKIYTTWLFHKKAKDPYTKVVGAHPRPQFSVDGRMYRNKWCSGSNQMFQRQITVKIKTLRLKEKQVITLKITIAHRAQLRTPSPEHYGGKRKQKPQENQQERRRRSRKHRSGNGR